MKRSIMHFASAVTAVGSLYSSPTESNLEPMSEVEYLTFGKPDDLDEPLSLEDLNADVLEMIFGYIDINSATASEIARLSLLCSKLYPYAQRTLYKRFQVVTESQWRNIDATVQRFKEGEVYDRIRSFTLACPSTLDRPDTDDVLYRALAVVEEVKPKELSITGNAMFYRYINHRNFNNLTSLKFHLYDMFHWRYDMLAEIVNRSALTLRELTIGIHCDGQIVDEPYELEPLPALHSFTLIHIYPHEEPFGDVDFLAKLAVATENGKKLRYLCADGAHAYVRTIAGLLTDLLPHIECLRLCTTYESPSANVWPMLNYITRAKCPKLKRLECNIKHPDDLRAVPEGLDELHFKMQGGPDCQYWPVLKGMEDEFKNLKSLHLYDIWRFPETVKVLKAMCRKHGVYFYTYHDASFTAPDGRKACLSDYIAGRYVHARNHQSEWSIIADRERDKDKTALDHLEELREYLRDSVKSVFGVYPEF